MCDEVDNVGLQVEYAAGDDDEEDGEGYEYGNDYYAEEEEEQDDDDEEEEEEEEEEDDDDDDYEDDNGEPEDDEHWNHGWGTGLSGDSRSNRPGHIDVESSASSDADRSSDKVGDST